jgi:hypothetical protein
MFSSAHTGENHYAVGILTPAEKEVQGAVHGLDIAV